MNVPVDRTAHNERQVELQGNEHTQREGQCRDSAGVEHQGNEGTDAVEQPGCALARHERFYHRSHGAGLRGGHHVGVVGCEAVSLVQDHDDTAHSGCADQDAQELECFLVLGRAAQPVADFQVGDEGTGTGEGGADYATHDEGSHHAAGSLQTHQYHDDGRKDERHECHATDGVTAHNGNGVGCHGGEKESDDSHNENAHDGEQQIASHHVEVEEEGRDDNSEQRAAGNNLHGEVALGASHLFGHGASFEYFAYEGERTADDAPAFHHTDNAGHGDAADTDAFGIVEQLLGRSFGSCQSGSTVCGDVHVGEDERNDGYDEPPNGHRAEADDGCIFKADDVAHTQQCSAGVAAENQFSLVGKSRTHFRYTAGEVFCPRPKGGYHKVVEAA